MRFHDNGTVWADWVTSASATTCTVQSSTGDVWTGWLNCTTSSTTSTAYDWTAWNAPLQLTQAQKDAQKAERLKREEDAKKRAEERVAARERAKRLLLESLDEEQKKQYAKDKFFYVLSEKGDRRYRIKQGSHGNVELVNPEGRVVHRYCAAPTGRVPEEDAMLAQKLFLELNEQDFLKVANVS
jgi:hypothetical protein